MTGYGKGPATDYSSYYKSSSSTPGTNSNSDLSSQNVSTDPAKDSPADALKRRRAALQRRLNRMKVAR